MKTAPLGATLLGRCGSLSLTPNAGIGQIRRTLRDRTSRPENDPAAPLSSVRLADLLTGLTLVCDLGMNQPQEESLRSSLVATGLARALDLPEQQVSDVFYTAMLQHVGCTAFAHETAALMGGDDRLVNAAGAKTNFSDPKDLFVTMLPALTRSAPLLRKARLTASALARGSKIGKGVSRANCEVAAMVAERLGLGKGVQVALLQGFEWFNGKGDPHGLAGDDIALPIRITHVASIAVLFHALGGTETALEALERRRAGGILDPELTATFVQHGPGLLAEAFEADVAMAVPTAEPAPVRKLTPKQLDETARVFGEVADLKSPYLHGHSATVAEHAQNAGDALGLKEAANGQLRLAGLLHDIGRVGVASGVWDKPGPLSAGEWEQVRLHAYYTERILRRSPPLASLAELAGAHHERCDGTGYHRETPARNLPMAARVLAAADVFAALTQDRPHRPAMTETQAAETLTGEAQSGALDADAVGAVLKAVGHGGPAPRRRWPAKLTDRQVDVLRLLAQGCSNRQIAERLVVSSRTAEHHVQDIYLKIGVSSRAAAAMFAMRHDLLA